MKSISDNIQLEIEHCWDSVELTEVDGIIHIVADVPTSFEEEEFVDLLLQMSAGVLELFTYNSQVGEYLFYNLEHTHVDYAETEWQWLDNPTGEENEQVMSGAESPGGKPWWKIW